MVVLLMDNVDATDISGSYDSDSYFKENATLQNKYVNSDYIHINIPVGNDAITKYENTINDVATIDVKKYDLVDFNSESNFKEVLDSLIATINYYIGISEVYNKTDFVISDKIDLETENKDSDAIFGIFISSKEKYLVNKAIAVLGAKIDEMDGYKSNYYENIY